MYRVIGLRRWRGIWCVAMAVVIAVAAVAVGRAAEARTTAAGAVQTAEGVRLPVIMYHGLLEEKSRQGRYVIDPSLLRSDLQYLQDHGYTTVVVADLIAYVDEGRPLPDKPVMLTFDDGYYNNYLYADPLLREFGMRAVLSPIVYWTEFYTEKESDRPIYSHVTWDEMRRMSDSGVWEIQNHSYNMHYATAGKRKGTSIMAGESVAVYQAALRSDLTMAQERLLEHLGVAPTAMTFPFGAISAEAMPVIREIGFRATFTCRERINIISRDPDCLIGLGRYLRPAGKSSDAYFKAVLAQAAP